MFQWNVISQASTKTNIEMLQSQVDNSLLYLLLTCAGVVFSVSGHFLVHSVDKEPGIWSPEVEC